MTRLTEEFRVRITALHGRAGEEWLARLPETLAACARRWGLVLGRAYEPLSYNYVLRARRTGGKRLVLKVGFPCRELRTEEAALRLFEGRGSVRLVDSDAELGALLLERIEPGTPLVGLVDEDGDEEATRAAARVMRELWRPVPPSHDFPTAADWLECFGRLRARFGGGCGPLPPGLVGQAETLTRELLGSASAEVLLHGDLHHGNILSARRRPWLAVDPKGLIGEPAYETGSLLRNPLPQLFGMRKPAEILRRRVGVLAEELGVERERVRGWGLVQAVLSACWTIEDGETDWQTAVECARLLQ